MILWSMIGKYIGGKGFIQNFVVIYMRSNKGLNLIRVFVKIFQQGRIYSILYQYDVWSEEKSLV